MKRFLLTAAIVAATLSSCSKNEIDYNLETADNAISFGVYTGINTKAEVTSTSTIREDGFYVFGYYTEENDFDASSYAPNFMYNQLVEYTTVALGSNPNSTAYIAANSWYYSPVKYWSETESDQYSFFAYAPEVAYDTDPIATLSTNATKGTPYITFDLTSTTNGLNDMVDFVADARVNVTSGKDDTTVDTEAADNVTFLLLHETTRINLTAITNITYSTDNKEEGNTSVVVTKVELSGGTLYDKAQYTFSTTDDAATTEAVSQVRGNWSSQNSGATLDLALASETVEKGEDGTTIDQYSATGVEVPNGSSTATDLLGDDTYQFLIPLAATATPDITITVTYDIVTEDAALDGGYTASYNNTKTVKLPTDASVLQQGVAYNLELLFSLNEVVLTATVDANWGSEDITLSSDIEE